MLSSLDKGRKKKFFPPFSKLIHTITEFLFYSYQSVSMTFRFLVYVSVSVSQVDIQILRYIILKNSMTIHQRHHVLVICSNLIKHFHLKIGIKEVLSLYNTRIMFAESYSDSTVSLLGPLSTGNFAGLSPNLFIGDVTA